MPATDTFILCALLSAVSGLLQAAPMGTAFTYQGRLTDGSNPANGSYDLKFTLFETNVGGAAVAGPTTNAAVVPSNGRFTLALDFGAGIFTGNARWLEIGVRTNGSASDFTTLSPRQPVMPSPYALYAPGAVTADGIAGGQGVKSLNSLRDEVSLTAGTNVSISVTGNGLRISATPQILDMLRGTDTDSVLRAINAAASANGTLVKDYFACATNPVQMAIESWFDENVGAGLTNRWTVNWEWLTNATSLIITSGLRSAGFNMIVVSDGWQNTSRDANGDLQLSTNWPAGMTVANIADYLHTNGLLLGLYTSFSYLTCGQYPASTLSNIDQDMRSFAAWGVDLVKVDTCNEDYYFLTNAAWLHMRSQRIGDAVKNSGGKMLLETVYYCQSNYNMTADVLANANSIWVAFDPAGAIMPSMDAHSHDYITSWWYLATNDTLRSWIRRGHSISAGWATYMTPYSFAMACICSSPIEISSYAGLDGVFYRRLLTNSAAIAILRDPAQLMGWPVVTNGAVVAWKKPLGYLASPSMAVCVFHTNTATQGATNITLHWSDFGYGTNAVVQVSDVLNRNPVNGIFLGLTNWGSFRNSVTFTLTPHSNDDFRLLKLDLMSYVIP